MIWFKQSRPSPSSSPTPRRRVLSLDCLEDRFAPALLGSLGQTFIDAVPPTLVAESSVSPIAQFAVDPLASPTSFIGNVARADDAPIGFFHRFCQNGFVSGEMIEIEQVPPRPRPVQPPLQPAAALARPQALPEIVETPFPVTPPAAVLPPAAVEAPAPLPPRLEIIPATYARPAPASIAGLEEEQSAPFVIDERLATAVFATDSDAITPAAGNSSRTGLFLLGGLMAAASLLYVRSARERRYEEFITYGH